MKINIRRHHHHCTHTHTQREREREKGERSQTSLKNADLSLSRLVNGYAAEVREETEIMAEARFLWNSR